MIEVEPIHATQSARSKSGSFATLAAIRFISPKSE
jgi:hypothetical protein